MSVAVLADVHGNLPALRAVLAEIATLGVATIVVGANTGETARSASHSSPDSSAAREPTYGAMRVIGISSLPGAP
jgi:hypothetical protein